MEEFLIKVSKRMKLINALIKFNQKEVCSPDLSYNKTEEKIKIIRKLQNRLKLF